MKKNKSEATASNASHTPTPWKIRLPMPVNLSTGKSEVVLMRGSQSDVWDGENIAEVFATSHNTALANAEFIIKAVNSYESRKELERKNEALLEAAKHLFIFSRIHQSDISLDEKFEDAKDDLRKAIAQAEERP